MRLSSGTLQFLAVAGETGNFVFSKIPRGQYVLEAVDEDYRLEAAAPVIVNINAPSITGGVFNLVPKYPAPPSVTNLAAEIGLESVHLTWTAVPSAVYIVRVLDQSDALLATYNTDDAHFTVEGLSSNTTYKFRVWTKVRGVVSTLPSQVIAATGRGMGQLQITPTGVPDTLSQIAFAVRNNVAYVLFSTAGPPPTTILRRIPLDGSTPTSVDLGGSYYGQLEIGPNFVYLFDTSYNQLHRIPLNLSSGILNTVNCSDIPGTSYKLLLRPGTTKVFVAGASFSAAGTAVIREYDETLASSVDRDTGCMVPSMGTPNWCFNNDGTSLMLEYDDQLALFNAADSSLIRQTKNPFLSSFGVLLPMGLKEFWLSSSDFTTWSRTSGNLFLDPVISPYFDTDESAVDGFGRIWSVYTSSMYLQKANLLTGSTEKLMFPNAVDFSSVMQPAAYDRVSRTFNVLYRNTNTSNYGIFTFDASY